MYSNSSFNLISVCTSRPKLTRIYLICIWQYIFSILILQQSFMTLRSLAHLLIQLHNKSIFVSGGRSIIKLEPSFNDLIITLSNVGSKSAIERLLRPIIWNLDRGGWTNIMSIFLFYIFKKSYSKSYMRLSTSYILALLCKNFSFFEL